MKAPPQVQRSKPPHKDPGFKRWFRNRLNEDPGFKRLVSNYELAPLRRGPLHQEGILPLLIRLIRGKVVQVEHIRLTLG